MTRALGASLLSVLLAAGCAGAPPNSSSASVASPAAGSSSPATRSPSTSPPSARPTATLVPSLTSPPTSPPATVPGSTVVERRVPALATAPPVAGTAGLDWRLGGRLEGAARVLAHGPAGWLSFTVGAGGDVEPLVTPHVSTDLMTWRDLTPTTPELRCGSDGGLAASEIAYVFTCPETWRSVDGRAWATVPAGEITQVASDGRVFVGWNGHAPSDAISRSGDGRTWTRVKLPGATVVVVDVLVGRPSGGFIAAGRVAPSRDVFETEPSGIQSVPYAGEQAIWTSRDGLAWTRLPLGSQWAEMRITSIAADGPGGGIVVAGIGGPFNPSANVEPVPVVVRSIDLRTWTVLDGPTFRLVDQQYGETRVLATAERWLIFGRRPGAGAGSPGGLTELATVAGSEDGRAWWGVTSPGFGAPPSSANRLATDGRVIVALISIARGIDLEATEFWVSPG